MANSDQPVNISRPTPVSPVKQQLRASGNFQRKSRQVLHLEKAKRDALLSLCLDVVGAEDLQSMLENVVAAARQITDARVASSGHGYIEGRFRVGAVSAAEDARPCPPGEQFQIERGGAAVVDAGAAAPVPGLPAEVAVDAGVQPRRPVRGPRRVLRGAGPAGGGHVGPPTDGRLPRGARRGRVGGLAVR
ncbi:MAG: hypothetical protein ACQERN_08835 [Thermodesulfobacteriota bacterium]